MPSVQCARAGGNRRDVGVNGTQKLTSRRPEAEFGDRLSRFFKPVDALGPSLRYAISTLKSAKTLRIFVQDEDAQRKMELLFAGKVVTAHLLEWLPKLRRVQLACDGVTEVLWEYAVSDEVFGCTGSPSRSELVVMRCLEAL
jgi:hypothetical protein